LAAQEAVLKNVETADVADEEIELMIQNDRIAGRLATELEWQEINQVYKKGDTSRGEKDIKTIQDQFNARKAVLIKRIRQKRRAVIQAEIQKLQNSVSVLAEEEQTLRKQVEAKQKEVVKFGYSSVDIEMLRADIKSAETLLSMLVTERDRLRIESRAGLRVTLLQAAEAVPNDPVQR
jgi:peptidoglycan hydrolase CwlO-like protein